jgi:ubiquinone/menaquinone biosynthesis C-methylase UbiE
MNKPEASFKQVRDGEGRGLRTKPLPVRLREMWNGATDDQSRQQCAASQRLELNEYAAIWTRALLLPGEQELVHSTLVEIARWREIDDLSVVRRRCETAVLDNKRDWEQRVHTLNTSDVEQYYDSAASYIDELMWWHTIIEDNSPLAYVAALEYGLIAGCRTYLDFGSGVGSGALLFKSHGFDVSLADISNAMLAFSQYRFARRARHGTFVDLKQTNLPEQAFDFVTAMDVFEHLIEPAATVDALDRCLRPGGYIYGRFASETDPERPQHIVNDFGPVFERFAELGFKEVDRDDWLWGHQVFRKET